MFARKFHFHKQHFHLPSFLARRYHSRGEIAMMSMKDLLKLEKAIPLVVVYYNLIKQYADIPLKEVERI